MRLIAATILALSATPAFAQQAPERPLLGPQGPVVSENYRGQPFMFDLLLRTNPVEEGERTRFMKLDHQAICLAEMNDSLRKEGLAARAREVYRDCANRLAEAARRGEAISPPPPRSMLIPLKAQSGAAHAVPLPPPCEPPVIANEPASKPPRPTPCPAR